MEQKEFNKSEAVAATGACVLTSFGAGQANHKIKTCLKFE